MAEKLKPQLVGTTLAALSAIWYVACALLFAAAPQGTLALFGSMFHGIDITRIAAQNLTATNTILGFVVTIVSAFVTGWFFAALYNWLAAKLR